MELRVLDGPNLYFTRPAIKLTLGITGWLRLSEPRAAQQATRFGLPEPCAPGAPNTEQRRRFVARLAAHLTRSLAKEAGTHLAVRGRLGPTATQIVVAYPWRRQKTAAALGREVWRILANCLSNRRVASRVLRASVLRLDRVEPGPAPAVPEPAIPVVAVTGTNGKTTTVRLLAHLIRVSGRSVAYTTTDGVYLDEQLVVEGDYSGFGGAGRALAQPGIDAAVLETARGGILLRGIGTAYNDVAIVTNVSADHLDQHGIRTLDQMAEVKATITRITKPDGWDVLNADDPRVLEMRRVAHGRPWVFTLDPDHPAIRSVLAGHGRAITVIDGWVTILAERREAHRLLRVEEIPITLAGIASHHVQNVLAAAAGAIGIGIPEATVVRGLRTFLSDAERNPGRANLYEVGGRVVVVDYAHNEDGMKGLVEICRRLRKPEAAVWLSFGSAGDRTDALIHQLAYIAARGADHLAVYELHRYLRGRDPAGLVDQLRRGAADGGAGEIPVFPNEVHALDWMLSSSRPNDVVAVTALSQRAEIFTALQERGARPMLPEQVRELVSRVGGSLRKSRPGGSVPRQGWRKEEPIS